MTRISKPRRTIPMRFDRALSSLSQCRNTSDLLPSQKRKLAQSCVAIIGEGSRAFRARETRRANLLHDIASNVGVEAWLICVQALSPTTLSDENPDDLAEIASQWWSKQGQLDWLTDLSRSLWATHGSANIAGRNEPRALPGPGTTGMSAENMYNKYMISKFGVSRTLNF